MNNNAEASGVDDATEESAPSDKMADAFEGEQTDIDEFGDDEPRARQNLEVAHSSACHRTYVTFVIVHLCHSAGISHGCFVDPPTGRLFILRTFLVAAFIG